MVHELYTAVSLLIADKEDGVLEDIYNTGHIWMIAKTRRMSWSGCMKDNSHDKWNHIMLFS